MIPSQSFSTFWLCKKRKIRLFVCAGMVATQVKGSAVICCWQCIKFLSFGWCTAFALHITLPAAPQCFRVVNQEIFLGPLHPNISMHIPHTVLHTFPKVQTKRIFFKIKSLFRWWSFPLFMKPLWVIWRWFVKRNWMWITLRDQMVKSLVFIFFFVLISFFVEMALLT